MADRVLITTDDLEQAVRINASLEASGYDTATVSSLDDVRSAVRGREPDAIVLTGGLHESTAPPPPAPPRAPRPAPPRPRPRARRLAARPRRADRRRSQPDRPRPRAHRLAREAGRSRRSHGHRPPPDRPDRKSVV